MTHTHQQSELFDVASLVDRLGALGLRGIGRVETHENRSVMVSVTPGGVLRVHQGFAYAPDSVLSSIVAFVNPGTRRSRRSAAQQEILAFPVHAFVTPKRVHERPVKPSHRDRPAIRQLAQRHGRLNERHFGGALSRVRFRLSRRMCRKLGEVALSADGGRVLEIAISYRHIERDGWDEVEHTLLHEMIHQWQAEGGHPVDHGVRFRAKAREVGALPRAVRSVRIAHNR